MHTRRWLLLLVLVQVVWLLLLMITSQRLQLLLIHILEGWLHSVLVVETIQLVGSEIIHHALIHIVSLLFMIKVSIHLLIE